MKIVLTRGYIRGIYHGVIGTLGFMLLGAMLLKALMI